MVIQRIIAIQKPIRIGLVFEKSLLDRTWIPKFTFITAAKYLGCQEIFLETIFTLQFMVLQSL